MTLDEYNKYKASNSLPEKIKLCFHCGGDVFANPRADWFIIEQISANNKGYYLFFHYKCFNEIAGKQYIVEHGQENI
jgi:hypothetical protein